MAMPNSQHRLYDTWKLMMRRCYDPEYYQHHHYGGRGIKVNKRWHKCENFLADMETTHEEGLHLDRINNNKGYSKQNCRWTDAITQNNNRRNNRLFEFMNKKLTLSQWARELGINRSTLAQRFYVYNWSIEKTLKGELLR